MFTNLLSAITGQFTRALVLGAFVPALLYVILGLVVVVPLVPSDWSILKPLEVLGTESPIIAVAFFTILLTGLLYNLNNSLIRLFEGYPWQRLWIGQRRTDYYTAQFDAANTQRTGMRTLIRAMEQRYKDQSSTWSPDRLRRESESIEDVNKKRTRVGLAVNTDFPHRRSLVLPTKLGNAIRSFETYPNRQYGIDGVSLWPRLIAKVAPDYGGAVGDAKTSFDFVLNCIFLSGLMALTTLIAGLLNPLKVVASVRSASLWLAAIIIFTLLAFVLYRALIGRARAWGEMFSGAFDLYRKELLTQLGYEGKFASVAEETRFWEVVSRQVVYGYPPPGKGQPIEYVIAPTIARSSTPEADLAIARGVDKPGTDGKVKITVYIENTDGRCDAEGVIVTDTLVEGFHYVWDTACVKYSDGTTNNAARLKGTNPFVIDVGLIKKGNHVVLEYCVLPIAAE